MKQVHVIQQEGYRLMHEGMKELSIVELNGIRIDMDKLEKTIWQYAGNPERPNGHHAIADPLTLPHQLRTE